MNDVTRDIWARWRGTTQARIGLGRSGDAMPTAPLLEFQAAHSRARDAVHGAADFAAIATQLAPHPTLSLHSRAADRATYLRRPDLGRRLDPAGLDTLAAAAGDWDVAFVVADGLSARAVVAQAVPLLQRCFARLADWRIAPVALVQQGRVAIGDEIGAALKAAVVAVLIGERPGLSVADSLGVYLTWAPQLGRVDSERNCISNIHANGLQSDQAADLLVWLLTEARQRKLSGIALKVDPAAVLPST